MKGKCLKCGTTKCLTRHYVLPKRHWKGKGKIVTLCRKCHDIADLRNDELEKYCYGNLNTPLPEAAYLKVFNKFLMEG
jgi:hypothetical protein